MVTESNFNFVRAMIFNRKVAEEYLKLIESGEMSEEKSVIRRRLEQFRKNDLNSDKVPEKRRAEFKSNIEYLLDNITQTSKIANYITDTIDGKYQPLIDFLSAQNVSISQRNKRHKRFKNELFNHSKKEEFEKYVLQNEEVRESIIGQVLKMSSNKNTTQIQQESDISDDQAIEYIKYILTSKNFVASQRPKLFPRTSDNKVFQPIQNMPKLFPALNFLLNNEKFDEEYEWMNEAPTNLKLQLTIKKLSENLGNKDATGVQALFNKIVRKIRTSKTGTKDVGQLSSATTGEGGLRNINKFLSELKKPKYENEKNQFKTLLTNQRVASRAILNTEWQMIVDYFDEKDGARNKLKEYLKTGNDEENPNPNPILAIKTIKDIRRIFNTEDKKRVFKEMTLSKDGQTRRVKNAQEIELLSELFYSITSAKDILTEKFTDEFFEKYKKEYTLLTDGKYNASREELPDILEFLIEVDLYYVKGNQMLVNYASKELADADNKVYDAETFTTELGNALITLLKICSEHYPTIRKDFIDATKKTMVQQSRTTDINSYEAIIDFFDKNNLLMEEK